MKSSEVPAAPPAAERSASERRSDSAGSAAAPLRVAVVGVPNTGKSLLFRRLSGRFATSANYPRTTTTLQHSRATVGGRQVVLIDTPGLTGFEFCSEDERPTRDLLFGDEPPDVVVQCADAGDLARSLLLTAQLADLQLPLLLCVNMTDEAARRGLRVDATALSERLGIPAIEAAALDGRGISQIGLQLFDARSAATVPYPPLVEEQLGRADDARSRAARIAAIVGGESKGGALPGRIWHMVLEAHRHWARETAAAVVRQVSPAVRRSLPDALTDFALRPLGGWTLLALALVGVYLFVSQVGVRLLADGMDRQLVAPIVGRIAALVGPGTLQEVLVGEFGLLSLGLFNALCTVLPILTAFYLAFGFLEDVGYFPLLSVHLDRLLRVVGLTGRAVLPMTLGFGCNTVATMATSCMENQRQRFIACFLISLGIPCAVQLGVIVAILATLPAFVLAFVLGIILFLEVLSGVALARLLPRRGIDAEHLELLVELPPLRRPLWRNIAAKTFHRVVGFLREGTPAFVASAALMLALDISGALAWIRAGFAPVVITALGLPPKAAEMLLMTVARREVGAVMMKEMVDRGEFDLRQTFIGLLVMTLFVPCMSNTMVMGRVLGWLSTVLVFIFVTVLAIAVGTVANLVWGLV